MAIIAITRRMCIIDPALYAKKSIAQKGLR
jgi:hypothetical protein